VREQVCRVVVIKAMPDTVTHGFPKECRATGRRLCDGLLAALQPRTESDGAGLEKPTGRQCLHQSYFPVLEEVVEAQLENWRNGNENPISTMRNHVRRYV